MREFFRLLAVFASASFLCADTSVVTYHNDVARTGQQTNETILTLANVNSTDFGKLFSQSVDGQVYAQPLYMPNVTLAAGGTHNIVFVATEHDSVYAFDADDNSGANANPLWHVSFPGSGVTSVPSSDTGCGQITSEIGITATPVIDGATGTLYVVAMTKETSGGTTTYVHRVHALDVASGNERPGSPVVVQASVPGTGDGGSTVTFVPKNYKSRPGLLLLNGMVYTAWSSHCDIGTYHGWLIGYNAANLQLAPVIYNTSAYGRQTALWASGAGPAADAFGNVYLNTANGLFDGGPDYGDSFLKLSTSGGLSVLDYFSPSNTNSLDSSDGDLGSGGVLVLPDSVGGASVHQHLLVGAGKQGTIYLADRDGLGGFNSSTDQVVQELPGAISGGSFGMPAYFNGSIYYGGSGDSLKAFSIASAALSTTPTSKTTAGFSSPGMTPSISANGSSNGIVWGIANSGGQIALHAFDAGNLGNELYNSGNTGGRDSAGGYVKFTVPTIANGKVYVAGVNALTVFGELPPAPPTAATPVISPAGGNFTSPVTVTITDSTVGAAIHYTTDGSTPTALSATYSAPFIISKTTTVKAIAVASGYANSSVASKTYNIKHKGHP